MTVLERQATAAICLAVALAAIGAEKSFAAKSEAVAVTHAGRTFHITLDAVVDAPARRVYEILADYSRLGKLNSAITSIRVRPSPTGRGERVHSVFNACVWFFCRRIVQVEDVTEPDAHTIAGRIVPGQGDFESGACFWRVTPDGDARTRLHYEATRVVGFWIPPLIGTWAIARTLREQLVASVTLLERVAGRRSSAPSSQGAGFSEPRRTDHNW